jgi:hypothetical protein
MNDGAGSVPTGRDPQRDGGHHGAGVYKLSIS